MVGSLAAYPVPQLFLGLGVAVLLAAGTSAVWAAGQVRAWRARVRQLSQQQADLTARYRRIGEEFERLAVRIQAPSQDLVRLEQGFLERIGEIQSYKSKSSKDRAELVHGLEAFRAELDKLRDVLHPALWEQLRTQLERALGDLRQLTESANIQDMDAEAAVENVRGELPRISQETASIHQVLQEELGRMRKELEINVRAELERSQRRSFWPGLLQNFLMNLLFFGLGVAVTIITSQPH